MSLVSGTSYVTEIFEGNRNTLTNGSLNNWKLGTSFVSIVTDTETAVRFKYHKIGAVIHDVLRSTDVPTYVQSGIRSNYSLHLDVTTADASIATGDYCIIEHDLSGFDFSNIHGGPVVLSFWVKAAKTGIHCLAFRNTGDDRSYISEYTVNIADTWEKKIISMPMTESGGTWDYTTGTGLKIAFTQAAGATFHTTKNVWQTGNFLGTVNQVNELDNVANNFRVALVQLEKGNTVSPFEGTSFKSDDVVLRAGDVMTGSLTTAGSIAANTVSDFASLSLKSDVDSRRMVMQYNQVGEVAKLVTFDASNVKRTELIFDLAGNVTVNGVAPTDDAHLTRKDYVDTLDFAIASEPTATFTETLDNSNYPLGISRIYQTDANSPDGVWAHALTVKEGDTRGFQISVTDTDPELYWRNQDSSGTAWQPWSKALDATGDTMTGTLQMQAGITMQPSNQIFAAGGSLTAPGYCFSGDGNTGMTNSVGNENLDLVTNGVSRLHIGSDGKIDIAQNTRIGGTPVASVYELSVQSTASTTWLEILNNGGTNQGAFFGLSSNAFQLWNYQGGAIEFYTNTTPSGGARRLTIENNGTLNIGATANYETLVTADDDIPNKKYVDDEIAAYAADFIHVQPTSVQDVGGTIGAKTAINWNTTPLHVDTATFTHSSVTNSSRIEVEVTGRYEVKCNLNTDNTGADRQVSEIYIRTNGSTDVLRTTATDYSRGSIYDVNKNCLMITEIELTANDYIEIMHNNQDADLATHVVNTVVAKCEFIMRRIG